VESREKRKNKSSQMCVNCAEITVGNQT